MAIGFAEFLLKPIVARPRPSPALIRVYEITDSYSFPSATSLLALVLFGLISYFVCQARQEGHAPTGANHRLAAVTTGLSLLGVVLVGLSRVYVGEHWPTDILGSWLFGGALLSAVVVAYQAWLGEGSTRDSVVLQSLSERME